MALDFEKIRKVQNQLGLDKDARLSNPSESTRINNIYTKEKALKPTQKVDPDRTGIEEFVPVIGDALDFTKIGEDINDKNYGQAALGLGLLLIPNAIEKPIKAGVKALKKNIVPIILNNVVDKVPTLRNQYFKMQDKKALEGLQDIFESFNGSRTLDNNRPYFKTQIPILNNDIKDRAEKIGINAGAIGGDLNRYNNMKVFIEDNKRSNAKILKNSTPELEHNREFQKDFISTRERLQSESAQGTNLSASNGKENYNIIGINRYNSKGLRPLNDIKGTSSHEATHLMQDLFNINLNEDLNKINSRLTIKNDLKTILRNDNDWSKKPNELQSNLWRFRNENKIGTRNLTDAETDKFIEEYGYKHFDPNANKLKINEILKLIPAVGGLMIYNNMSNENDKQTKRKMD